MVGGVLQRNEINCTDPGLQLGDPAPLTALLLARASETVEGVKSPLARKAIHGGESRKISLSSPRLANFSLPPCLAFLARCDFTRARVLSLSNK